MDTTKIKGFICIGQMDACENLILLVPTNYLSRKIFIGIIIMSMELDILLPLAFRDAKSIGREWGFYQWRMMQLKAMGGETFTSIYM